MNNATDSHIVHKKMEAYLPKDASLLDRPLIQQNIKPDESSKKSDINSSVFKGFDPCLTPKNHTSILSVEVNMSLKNAFENIFGFESASSQFSRKFWVDIMKFKGLMNVIFRYLFY